VNVHRTGRHSSIVSAVFVLAGATSATAQTQAAVWTQGTGWPEYIYVQSLALDPQNPSRIWAGGVAGQEGSPGLFRSDDDGHSWATITGPDAPGDVQAIAIHPENASNVFTGFDLVRRSDDGGSHWASFVTPAVERGWFGYGAVNALAIDPHAPGRLWAATSAGLSRSDDGGQSWTGAADLTKEVYRILFDGRRPGTIYASSYDREELVDSFYYPEPYLTRVGGTISSSADGGETWAKRKVVDFPILSFAIDPFEAGVVYAGSLGAFYRGADYGNRWEKVSETFPWDWAFSIAADPVRQNRLYVAAGWDVYRSLDAGRTWNRLATGLPEGEVHALAISPDGRWLHAGSQGGTSGVYSIDLEALEAASFRPCRKDATPCPRQPRVVTR
jgi:photosystem II stability/assembly factor-like uncharacterized protein